MANVSIARRYARALIDVAVEAKKVDPFGEELERFVSLISSSKELSDVMVNPAYGRTERMAVTDAMLKALGNVDPAIDNFLKLLVERHRTQFLPDIARLYRDLADARMGRLRGKVTSAAPLPPDALQKISKLLEAKTERKVVLESKVDPSLLGGVATQVGSVLYDGSLKTQLEQLRRELQR